MKRDFVGIGSGCNGLCHERFVWPSGWHFGDALYVLLERQNFDNSDLAVLDGELDLAPQVPVAVVRDLHRLRERHEQRI